MRKNLKIWHPETCVIEDGAIIGDDVVIHPGCVIYNDVKIGDGTHIESQVFIPNGIEIGSGCFLAPSVKFANDSRPPSHEKHWKKTTVMDGAVIGIGSIILPGVTIGRGAFVAAGSLVTKSIPDGECWLGSPAKFYKKVKEL